MPIAAYGIRSELHLPERSGLQVIGCSAATPVKDACEAMRAALANPIHFPPLQASVVSGDRVTIAVGEALPRAASLVAGVVWELLDAGIEPESITVLRAASDARLAAPSLLRRLPADLQARIGVTVHRAADREQLCLLNISSHDTPIYLHRALVEADVVVPLGVAQAPEVLGDLGADGVLFPTFADQDTQQRYRLPQSSLDDAARRERLQEAHEAVWMLGTRLIVQVVPGAGESVLQVLAGDAEHVERQAREAAARCWSRVAVQPAALVLATISGSPAQQSWVNVARALHAATRIVDDSGTIVVCCDLQTKLGPALKRLSRAASIEEAERTLENDMSPDALVAAQLIRTLQSCRVFLLSRLEEETVQALGLAYVEMPDDVVRLVARSSSCVVLEDAHRMVPNVSEEVLS